MGLGRPVCFKEIKKTNKPKNKEQKTCVLFSPQKPLVFNDHRRPIWVEDCGCQADCAKGTVCCPGLSMSNCCVAVEKSGSQRLGALSSKDANIPTGCGPRRIDQLFLMAYIPLLRW